MRVCLRLILPAYLGLCLALGGLLHGQVWAAGGHTTPDQWLAHMVLDRLGLVHHHEPSPAAPVAARAIVLHPSLMPHLTLPPAGGQGAPDLTSYQGATPAAVLPPLQPAGRAGAFEPLPPVAPAIAPPDQPPRLVR
jgi:hypothetical protein